MAKMIEVEWIEEKNKKGKIFSELRIKDYFRYLVMIGENADGKFSAQKFIKTDTGNQQIIFEGEYDDRNQAKQEVEKSLGVQNLEWFSNK